MEDNRGMTKELIDFKKIVDSLDDSVFITNAEGKVLYVNPSYEKNTNISPEEVIGSKVSDIIKEGNLFSGGATLDVIRTHERTFRLATVVKNGTREVGYTIGVPIFNDDRELIQIVVSSRPIFSLQALQEDFGTFIEELNAIKDSDPNIRIVPNSNNKAFKHNNLIGTTTPLQKVAEIIKRSAPTDATILITGESGVGKEVIADQIYKESSRNENPFIKVNCASIPDNLLESELFGYEKGAFSGANADGKPGLFELANHGTILLDEIGDMPLSLQVKLLRVIQNRQLIRVGGGTAYKARYSNYCCH